jgi:hypothetical protein
MTSPITLGNMRANDVPRAETDPGLPPFSSMSSASRRKRKSEAALLAHFLRVFAEADAGAAAVFVDELDAGLF